MYTLPACCHALWAVETRKNHVINLAQCRNHFGILEVTFWSISEVNMTKSKFKLKIKRK